MDFFREYISASVSWFWHLTPFDLNNVIFHYNISSAYYNHGNCVLQKVESRIRIMSDLRELASAESLDAFTLVYSNILEHQPDCPVNNITKTKPTLCFTRSIS